MREVDKVHYISKYKRSTLTGQSILCLYSVSVQYYIFVSVIKVPEAAGVAALLTILGGNKPVYL